MHTVISPLQRARLVAAERTAVVCGDLELSYGQMWDRCRRLAGALRGLDMRPGDRVAVVGPNSHRYLEIYQAVPGSGLVLVPLNHRHTAAELRYALEDSGARVLFSGLAADGVGAGLERVIDLGDGYERLVRDAPPVDFPTDLSDDSLAGIFYTGGTTGAAKGVMLTHRNLVANAFHMLACQPFTRDTRWLIAAPLFHAAGSIAVMATVWNGGLQIVLPAFDASAALDLIEAHGATHTLVVPTMLAALSEEQLTRPRDVSSLRRISHGASPIATATLRRAALAFPEAELIHIYGTTETAPIATHLPHEELLLDAPQARSCGHPALGVDVRVVDGDGMPVPEGEVGEVVIRGPNVMAGYWRKPDATAAALAGGWYHTGDLGYMDEDAYIYLVDRAKDMIVTGGENVYSIEVEDVLQRHPAVGEAAVFGVPDPRWGEAVHAVVVPRGTVTEAELIAHCRGAIAGYKVPKRVELREAPLPKSGAGKVLKRELREPYWEGRQTRVSGG
jgi:long-chain acyl-CoA synthetase